MDLGRQPLTLEERVFQAVHRAGGRRGLARRTRETYSRFLFRPTLNEGATDTGSALSQVRGMDHPAE